MTLRTFSYGGGVQSTAALVLAAQKKIDFSIFLFSNVGDDSEHPATLAYVRDVAMPYAAANGIELLELRRMRRDGSLFQTVYQRVTDLSYQQNLIPFRLSNGTPGGRSCTADWKIGVIAREQKRRGATPESPAVCGLGISLDEFHRMKTDSGILWQILEYPLIDLRLTRQDCMNIIERAGLPIPPKSSCWFCPFHSLQKWREMRVKEPELFARSVEIERINNQRNTRNEKPSQWLTRMLIPLDQAVAHDQADMFDELDDACESGFCMT